MTTADELPHNHVLDVIDGEDTARMAVQELQQMGFSESGIFSAEELKNEVDAHGEKSNLLTRIAKAIPNHLSEQVDYLAQYQELAKNGSSVIAVRVADRDQAEQMRNVLGAARRP